MAKAPYIPRSVRTVELRTPRLPHEPHYQEVPRATGGLPASAPPTLEETIVPFGPHKGKMLLQLLNDHPGYLLHLSQEAFSDHEEFELAVEDFCAKYQHRLDRATGGAQSSTLWAVSICAFRNNKSLQAHVKLGVWVHEVITIQAVDHNQAESLAFAAAQKHFPAPEHQDHDGRILNIPLADLRRALKAESPGNSPPPPASGARR